MAGNQIKVVNPLKKKKSNKEEDYFCPSEDSLSVREERSKGSTEVLNKRH